MGNGPRNSRLFPRLLVAAALAAIYMLAGKLGLMLAFVHASATAVWPPAGIALAAFLILGDRVWPGIFIGAFLVNVTTEGSIATSLGIAAGNTLEGLAGAYLVGRYANGRHAFERAQDIFKFAGLAGLLSTPISATVGVTSLSLGGFAGWADYGSIWWTWWLGDVAGDLIVAPLLLLWYAEPRVHWRGGKILEAAALLLLLVLIGQTVFGGMLPLGGKHYPIAFLCFPVLLGVAFRFGQRETATATFVLSGIAIWGTLQGLGPFVRATQNESLLLLQAFMGVASGMTTAVAALVSESKRAEGTIRELNENLEQRLVDRTKALRENEERFSLLVAGVHDYAILMLDPAGRVISWNAGAKRIKGYAAAEILGEHFSCFYSPEDIAQGKPALHLRIAAEEGRMEDEGWRVRKDGSKFWANVVFSALRDESGHLRGFSKVTRDITERKQVEAIRKQHLEQVMAAQEDERARIARELHDETGQSLTALLFGLRALEKSLASEAVKGHVHELGRMTRETITNIKRMALRLRPSLLDDLGLEAALFRLSNDFTSTHKIPVRVHVNGLEGSRLPPEIEAALYRIAQEALTNIAKHASARTVSVIVTLTPSHVRMIVEDNGRGFAVSGSMRSETALRHLGLQGMRERAALLNGTLEIESTPGKGATVYAQIPIRQGTA